MNQKEVQIPAVRISYPTKATQKKILSLDDICKLTAIGQQDGDFYWATSTYHHLWDKTTNTPIDETSTLIVYRISNDQDNQHLLLIQAYCDTIYKAGDEHLEIEIEVGHKNPSLDHLLYEKNVSRWAYITGWNPHSKAFSEAENKKRNQQLKTDLKEYFVVEGQGIGRTGNWPPEESFLILGISRGTALSIGEKYGQNAILYGEKYGFPMLLFCSSFRRQNKVQMNQVSEHVNTKRNKG